METCVFPVAARDRLDIVYHLKLQAFKYQSAIITKVIIAVVTKVLSRTRQCGRFVGFGRLSFREQSAYSQAAAVSGQQFRYLLLRGDIVIVGRYLLMSSLPFV